MNDKQLHLVAIVIGALTLAAVVMLSDGQWSTDESWFVTGAATATGLIVLLMKARK